MEDRKQQESEGAIAKSSQEMSNDQVVEMLQSSVAPLREQSSDMGCVSGNNNMIFQNCHINIINSASGIDPPVSSTPGARIPAINSSEIPEVVPPVLVEDHQQEDDFDNELPHSDVKCTDSTSEPYIRRLVSEDKLGPLCGLQLAILSKLNEDESVARMCSTIEKDLKDILWTSEASKCLDPFSSHLMECYKCPLIKISYTDRMRFHLDVTSLSCLERLQEDEPDGSLAKVFFDKLLTEKMKGCMERNQLGISVTLDQNSLQEVHSYLISQSNDGLNGKGLQSFEYFCDYCKVYFEEEWQHHNHIDSDDHKKIVSTLGNEAGMTEREPPLTSTNGTFKYCRDVADKSCKYMGKIGAENECPFAHTTRELKEWQERHKHRLEVIQRIRDQSENLFALRDSAKGEEEASMWADMLSRINGKVDSLKSVGSIKYSKEEKIGVGITGSHIFAGKFENRVVAVKKILKENFQRKSEMYEVMNSKALCNILKILHIEENEECSYIVTELCEYDLKAVIEGEANPVQDNLTIGKRVKLCLDILRGLKSLHSIGIIHGDLKPNNILLGLDGEAKIILATTHVTHNNYYGPSICWLPWENVSSENSKGMLKRESDVKVAGCLIYYILSNGHHPFEATSPYMNDTGKLVNNVQDGKFSLLHVENYPVCRALLTRMLDQDMLKRPHVDDCLKEMNDVRKSYISSAMKNAVTTDNIKLSMEHVAVDCKSKFVKYLPGKNSNRKRKLRWILSVKCPTVQLKKIYLWHNKSDTFSLSDGSKSRLQKLDMKDIETDEQGTYTICVDFESKTQGAFHQWLILDFGTKDVLCQQFLVWVGPEFSNHFPTDDGSTLWDLTNHEVVKFPNSFDLGSLCEELEEKYPLSEKISCFPKSVQLEPETFKDYFHEMVYDEEREQTKQLEKFNGIQEMAVEEKIGGNFRVKLPTGQLFGKIKWKIHLDDSEASQILKKSVHLALLKFDGFPETVYEAEIVVGKQYDLREVDSFIVKLSQQCVSDQTLKPGMKETVSVQFKVDRKKFCYYHYAVDKLKRKDLLFPPRNMFPRFLEVEDTNKYDDFSLHHKQEEARRSISNAKDAVPFGYGPSLIIGPCGTGKTFVLARTVEDILESDPNRKLLICTHSNSAADCFINEFLRGCKQNVELDTIIRVYETDIDPASVDEEIRHNWSNYDVLSKNFTIPDVEELCGYHVVVTTFVTAIHFIAISQLHGQFTHVFLDEAGQALETEAMIPLGLAGPRTVVVLAGDHKQMIPKVFSRKAQECNFQRSMLERLFYWSKRNNCNNFHFLTDNYRILSPEILAFIGEHCYHVKNFATAKSKDQQLASTTSSYPSMKFSAVSGEDKLEKLSYYNGKEAKEIVKHVLELLKKWPSEGGDFTDQSVAVLTSYESQVQHLRKLFPKKFLHSVNIDTVQNSQGQQFDVVFISTVRTKCTICTDEVSLPSLMRHDTDYYGMLSDEGELITALTRARILLWVVGDPTTLCSVGKCQKIWKEYIQVCAKMNDMPSDLTCYDPPAIAEEKEGSRINTDNISYSGLTAEFTESLQSSSSQDCETDMEDKEGFIPDEIISYLEKEVRKELFQNYYESSVRSEDTHHQKVAHQESVYSRPPPSKPGRKNKKFRRSSTHTDDNMLRNKLMSYNYDYSNLEGGYDFEVEVEPEEMDLGEIAHYTQLAIDFPDEYCTAIVQFAENDLENAVALANHPHDKILISGKRMRKHALDGDQVVIRKQNKENVSYGEVMCIKKRAEDLKWKKLVCTVDSENLMCPVDNSFFPKMVIYPGEKKKAGSEEDITIGLYSISPSRKIQFEKNVEVKSSERGNKLFVVQYLRWGGDHIHPIGLVTEELPPCDSPDVGLRILKLIHSVRENWQPSVMEEMKQYSEKWKIPQSEMKKRAHYDFRGKCVFTIDHSYMSDFAIHVEKLEDERVELGLHLADVPFFVDKDSWVDREALQRGSSFSSTWGSPTHMLPDMLSTDLCIFNEREERLSLSIVLTLDRCLKADNVVFCRSIICCKQNLTFENVENLILNKNDGNFDFKGQVMHQVGTLYKIMNRLPHLPLPLNGTEIEDQINFPLAYGLVERLRKLTNAQVTMQLRHFSEQGIPVCHQLPPKEQDSRLWCSAFEKDVHGMPDLPTSLFTEGDRAPCKKPIPVLRSTWEELRQIHEGGKDKLVEMQKLLVCSEGFPRRVAALANLSDITPQEEYTFTNADVEDPVLQHFSKQEDCIHPFMTPVRSFMHLVVLRMLIASTEKTNNPYSNDDLTRIAYHCTKQTQSAQNYNKKAKLLMFAFKAQVLPHHLQAVVHSSNEEELKFCYPFIGFLKKVKSTTIVPFRLLKPVETPVVKEVTTKVNWKNRIYISESVPEVQDKSQFKIYTKQNVINIPMPSLEKMFKSVQRRDYQSLEDMKDDWNGITQRNKERTLEPQAEGEKVVDDISCGIIISKRGLKDVRRYVKYVHFGRKFKPGDVVSLQLCSGIEQGLPVPRVQLLKMTEKLDLCLEHRRMPVQCFTEIADRMPQRCGNIEEYVKAWLPVLRMMVAYSTIMSDETIYIHNVLVTWTEKTPSSREIFGQFSLKKNWCVNRHIKFSAIPKKKKKKEHGVPGFLHPTEKFLLSDFICVRVPGKKVKDDQMSQLQELGSRQNISLKTEIPIPDTSTIVVHGEAGVTNDGKSASYDVKFQVKETSHNIKKCLLDRNTELNLDLCTVELIPKPEPETRMEAALASISTSNHIIQSIVLQRPIKEMINSVKAGTKMADLEIKRLIEEGRNLNDKSIIEMFNPEPPNESQIQALQKALSQPFTVIQGPPGTGKTRTGAYLTCLFMKINKKVPQKTVTRPQILYCGPSNKSVDVIALYLEKFLKKLKLRYVRVYSETIEQQTFPLPGAESSERKFSTYKEDAHMPEEIQKNALHYIIRSKEAGEDAQKIEEKYHDMFRDENNESSVKEYKYIVKKTKIKMLKERDIILCTCNAAGHSILKGNLNIVQCIIDEAGMCFELDNLIPLVSQRPKQVVFIGDHKQLRPIIQNPRAKQLGAEVSLMEKFCEEACTLKIQYRMHEEICKFPSREFYKYQLITDKTVKRRENYIKRNIWPGEGHPHVFCHIEGEEYSQTVRTSDGNELSKSNFEEACEVVRIAQCLIEKLKVQENDLVILTQYNLQCKLIRDEMKYSGINVKVQTVIKSQGSEWNFVLLSTVRSLPEDEIPSDAGKGWRRKNLGFIEDENQMNVGLTRAMQGLIIVGNKYLLMTCNKWKKLIQDYEATGSVVPAESFLCGL
ncbi:Helicase with zinc finger domain 2 [Holothuria leucospilota]|uniref:Helicase with zinc finger domain 2 n=1 Tax=Holothuria leucospilota TaxID=206669 RepID=A0A9Q1C6C4_HOLLE|nr:Helicase with zinc finger domain 2 [Holothuria leucospilota]